MRWYFYLNYYIYRFYGRYKGEPPVFRAWSTTTFLLSLNIFTIDTTYRLITDFWIIPTGFKRIESFSFLALLGLFNYLLLYRKKRYEEIFDDFKADSDYYKKWDKSVRIYIWSSVLSLLTVLAISVWRNHQLGII